MSDEVEDAVEHPAHDVEEVVDQAVEPLEKEVDEWQTQTTDKLNQILARLEAVEQHPAEVAQPAETAAEQTLEIQEPKTPPKKNSKTARRRRLW